MQLNEIIHQKIELKIEKLDKPLTFKNLTLADQAWLDDNYNSEQLTNVFNDSKTEDILKIASRFLDDKSKEYLSKIVMVTLDEFGEKVEVEKKYTLAEKLFSVCSEVEYIQMIRKLFEIRNRATELLIKMAEENKKKEEITTKTIVLDGKQ